MRTVRNFNDLCVSIPRILLIFLCAFLYILDVGDFHSDGSDDIQSTNGNSNGNMLISKLFSISRKMFEKKSYQLSGSDSIEPKECNNIEVQSTATAAAVSPKNKTSAYFSFSITGPSTILSTRDSLEWSSHSSHVLIDKNSSSEL